MEDKDNMFNVKPHSFASNDFVDKVKVSSANSKLSGLDNLLGETYSNADKSGAMNYSLDAVETKIIGGKFGLVAQLNPLRKTQRRKPSPFNQVVESYNPKGFNFTKIQEKEVLFNLKVQLSNSKTVSGSMIVNSAPICELHSLLLPSPLRGSPQLLDEEGMLLAVSIVLLSSRRSLRVGFNSLCAYASVNHYHYHAYLLEELLYLETANCTQVSGPCYTFTDYFAPGFVFEVKADTMTKDVSDVMRLTNHLISSNVPHNVFITRGASVKNQTSDLTTYDVVRVCVWAKITSLGAKDIESFVAALCELAGHIPYYNPDSWEGLTEEKITSQISKECSNVYQTVLPAVKRIYSKS